MVGSLLIAGCKNKQAQVATNGEKRTAPVEQQDKPTIPPIQSMELGEFDKGDDYVFLGSEIKGDILSLVVRYSGGCETHIFDLFADPRIMKSMPPQQNIVLKHDANGDKCRALITDTLSFDLSPIKIGDEGKIILRLYETEERITYSY